jgi:hypothetical protein
MSDQNPTTPVQPGNPGQQDSGTAGSTAPAGYIELARYNGLVRKVEELTLSNRDLNTQLTQKSSESEQLKGQLSIKDTEKTVAVGERDQRLNTALSELSTLGSEMKELRALKLKLEVANELKRPDLLRLAERIPALEDKEALRVIMQDFASFADEAVRAREAQLMAGVTPPVGPGSSAPAAPSTQQGWLETINKHGLGTPERANALNEYGNWLEKQNQR